MNLSRPPMTYDQQDEALTRTAISKADDQNIKVTTAIDKLMFRDTTDGKIHTVVMTSGAFVIT